MLKSNKIYKSMWIIEQPMRKFEIITHFSQVQPVPVVSRRILGLLLDGLLKFMCGQNAATDGRVLARALHFDESHSTRLRRLFLRSYQAA